MVVGGEVLVVGDRSGTTVGTTRGKESEVVGGVDEVVVGGRSGTTGAIDVLDCKRDEVVGGDIEVGGGDDTHSSSKDACLISTRAIIGDVILDEHDIGDKRDIVDIPRVNRVIYPGGDELSCNIISLPSSLSEAPVIYSGGDELSQVHRISSPLTEAQKTCSRQAMNR